MFDWSAVGGLDIKLRPGREKSRMTDPILTAFQPSSCQAAALSVSTTRFGLNAIRRVSGWRVSYDLKLRAAGVEAGSAAASAARLLEVTRWKGAALLRAGRWPAAMLAPNGRRY